MKSNHSSGSKFWVFVAVIAGLGLVGKMLPVLSKILWALLGIVGCLTALVIFLVIYFTKKDKKGDQGEKNAQEEGKEKTKAEAKQEGKQTAPHTSGLTLEQMRILSKGRNHLLELRGLAGRIGNLNVRKRSEDVCKEIEKILSALQQQPEDISRVRQFFNYYLPTLGNILLKYLRIEEGGAVREDTTVKVMACLREIQTAMEKQHAAIYDNDLVDLTVEMEALTMACKRDGLLISEDFTLKEGDREITLTL